MTYEEATRLVLTLNMNFAAFLPKEIDLAAAKKSMWTSELMKHDFHKGLEAVQTLIQTLQYPPTMWDLKTTLGVGGELTRDDIQARLPGPTFGPEMYSADMDRVDRLMAALDEELRTGKFTKTREEAVNDL